MANFTSPICVRLFDFKFYLSVYFVNSLFTELGNFIKKLFFYCLKIKILNFFISYNKTKYEDTFYSRSIQLFFLCENLKIKTTQTYILIDLISYTVK